MCDDFVYDPTLEELRQRKIGTGSFSSMCGEVASRVGDMAEWPLTHPANRKRKHDELFSDSLKDDPRYIASNTTLASCRASGLRGIYNAGATCYQNVILQCFLHNPLLRNFYLSDGHQSSLCESPHCLSCAMDDVFQEFYGQETTNGYTAANILSSFWISEKKAFANLVTTKEQDAHEFFQFLAEELHERNGDGKKPEHGSEHSCTCIIHQTFYGKLQSTTTCQQCNGMTNQVQSFLDLSLGVDNLKRSSKKALLGAGGAPNKLTLQQCLDEEYIKSDKCEYRCHKCNSTRLARRHTSIKSLPNVLSIQLKVCPVLLSPVSPFFCSCFVPLLTSPSASSTSRAATTRPSRSTRPSSSHCSLTCCRTPTAAVATRTRAKAMSSTARACTTCSASSCTSARSTRATTCHTVAWATSGLPLTTTASSWRPTPRSWAPRPTSSSTSSAL